MLFFAVSSNTGSIVRHAGPAASTVYINPVTSGQLNPVIAAPVIGYAPIFPVIADVGTLVIPASDSITKLPAPPRSTTPTPPTGGAFAVKFAVIFLFAFMVTVNGFVEPVASPLHDVNV